MAAVTLKCLFRRIAGPANEVTQEKLQTFIEGAGVRNSFLVPKASLAATAIMKKIDDGRSAVCWERGFASAAWPSSRLGSSREWTRSTSVPR